MPIPKPESGEKENDYVSRCMSAQSGEDKPEDQKLAICYSTFREAKKEIAVKFIKRLSLETKKIVGNL